MEARNLQQFQGQREWGDALTTAPVRAFFFDRSLPITGGVAHSFLYFGRHADPGRIIVRAVSCEDISADTASALADTGIGSTSIGDEGYVRPALRLRRLVAAERPDIVLCSSLKPYLLTKFAIMGTRTRAVFWHVGIAGLIEGRSRRLVYRMLARREDTLANSRATSDAFAFSGHRGRSHVVDLGVEDWTTLPEAAPLARLERAGFGIPLDAFVIGYTARFVPFKRHRVLVEAFASLAREHSDLHLVFIGIGTLQEAVRAEVARTPPANSNKAVLTFRRVIPVLMPDLVKVIRIMTL